MADYGRETSTYNKFNGLCKQLVHFSELSSGQTERFIVGTRINKYTKRR